MSDMPWFQFYPNDWLAGTRGLSAVETGVYITIIATLYDRAAPLPNDPERLARMCGASKRVFVSALNRLVEDGKLLLTEQGIWNERVAEELQNRNEKVEQNKKAALTRWNGKTQSNQRKPDAGALQTQCKTDAISEVRSQKSDISNHHTRDPDGWNQLEAQCREAAGWQNEPHPNLFVIGPIAALIEAGCILELDVLPTIRARSSACSGVKNWKYFISAIQQARDDRLGALTPANPSKPLEARYGNTAKRNSIADGFAIIDAAIAAEEQRLGQLGTTEISPAMGGQGLKLVS